MMIAFFSGTFVFLCRQKRMVEINFLCVHKKLRSKRLAPVLIREMTRRVNCTGIFQAVYTAGVVLPKPVATCRYWHRSLNPKKLIEVKFSHLSRNMTMQRHLKLYRLPEETKTGGLRKMKASDVPEACKLMNEVYGSPALLSYVGASYPFFVLQYLSRYDLAPIFNEEDFTHWFLPRDDIIQSYVVEGEKGKLTDMVRRGIIFGFENSIRRTFSQLHLPNRARYLVFEFYFTFPDLGCHFYFLIRI